MLPKIIDNGRKKLRDTLNEIAPSHDHLSIATGYWDLPGMQLIFENIKNYKSIRLIIGQEPLAPRFAKALNINEPEKSFPEADFQANLVDLEQRQEYRDLVFATKNLIAEGKLEVRVYRRSFLHAKAYIFGSYDSPTAVGVIGSSNFTNAGLTSNAELNALEDDHRIVKFQPYNDTDEYGHLSWFDTIWNDELTEEWNGTFSELLGNSPVGDVVYSPYDMYIKTLYELYADEIVDDTTLDDETADVLFEFQQRNAKLLLKKLEKYGLAMLADSVGLGKTITAGAVIKHYIEEIGAKRVYVIAPASLTEQWREDLAKVYKMFTGFEVISMQDMHKIEKARAIDHYAPVDLFVVDEAHNLRNDASQRHQELLEWFSENPDSKVLLLTATPINNSLTDFVNQIQLAAKGSLESFPVVYPTSKKNDVIDFFEAVKRLSSEMKQAENKGQKPDFVKVNRIMRQGLRHFLVRTTRKGIEREFGGMKAKDGTVHTFPSTVVTPSPYTFSDSLSEAVANVINNNLAIFNDQNPRKLDVDSLLEQTQRTQHPLDILSEVSKTDADYTHNVFVNVFQILLLLGFAPYRSETYQHRFYGKKPEELKQFKLPADESFALQSQMSVHNMMRVTLLKRLESSQYALRRSLENYQSRLDYFVQNLDKGYIIKFKDIQDIQNKFGDDLEAVLQYNETAESSEKIELVPADAERYNTDALRADLEKDRRLLEVLIELCQALGANDDKLVAFSKLMTNIIREQKAGKKVLVFSYFSDTVNYLRETLPSIIGIENFSQKAAFTSGENKANIESIVKRFSPISKSGTGVTDANSIDYLFATDVLSEGQNLQDCGTLINFDLHWNPVRMIQRNGRINRLGSEHSSVYIYNMHPETNLESYLKLVARLEQKIDRIKNTIGTDQSILGEAENPIEYIDDIDAETTQQNVTLELYNKDKATETFNSLDDDEELLSEDEYILDLRKFTKDASDEDKARIHGIPVGKWGYLPHGTQKDMLAPSVLALTRVRGTTTDSATDFETHIFIETTETTQPIETIQALGYIRTDKSDCDRQADKITADRELVKRRTLSVARSQAIKRQSPFKITASITRVLDALAQTIPELNVRSVLDNIVTKQDQRSVKKLFDTANRDLKGQGQLLPSTIAGFEKTVHKLEKYGNDEREVTSAEGTLYYAK
ncbi:MAG TPA: SNF2-related protein [Candidatus Saccharimonadales bacterium]|nr:SNF2-related protein [Candidatus Saccharimonadales bacterium]